MGSFGQGSIGRTNKPPAASGGSGFPFSAGSAHEGTSLDAAGKVVLGNDVGGTGAELTAWREINMNGNSLNLIQTGGDNQTVINGRFINILGQNAQVPFYDLTDNDTGFFTRLALLPDRTQLSSTTANMRVYCFSGNFIIGDSVVTPERGAKLEVLGTFMTAPSTPTEFAAWKLGQQKAAAVALDNASYVEAEINGVMVKLAVVI